jgi:DNA modification methylase
VTTTYDLDRMPLLVQADARALPLPDESVDLIVTSPPYFGLRSYTDGGEHYDGQIGSESTPREFIAALIASTRDWMRVLKPSGSIFVNLGDKYAADARGPDGSASALTNGAQYRVARNQSGQRRPAFGVPKKSLLLLPERFRIAAVDELGLIARAVLIWSKPNGLPESVTDRVRRSHEDWVHLTRSPRYFAAVDEIREPHTWGRKVNPEWSAARQEREQGSTVRPRGSEFATRNPLGKLPGSVWEIATQPLRVPAELGIDHYAAFPMEWPRRLILGWSPREVCTACGEGRRPVAELGRVPDRPGRVQGRTVDALLDGHGADGRAGSRFARTSTITGYACSCPDASASSTPGVVLDPFGGTGTTALVATMLGRRGVSVDLSGDYCRLAQWRASDPKERARAAGLDPDAVARVSHQAPGQESLLDLLGDAS